MNKIDFLKNAIKGKAYYEKAWLIGVFAITRPSNTDITKMKSFDIVPLPTGTFFVDPAIENQLTKIDDAVVGVPLFTFLDTLVVDASLCANALVPVETTIGNLLFNLACLVNAFNTKIPFITGKVSIDKIEDIIAAQLTDTPVNASATRDPTLIYVDEYIKFVDSLAYITGLSQLCVWANTKKTMTGPPGVAALRDKLIKQYTGQLHDPAVIAEIEKVLIEYDAAYLKGDPGGDNFANSKKMRTNIRKKLFLMFGAEAGIEDTVAIDPIFRSLEEGWEAKDFPQINNSLRAGSYSRGAETQLGGLLTKELLRASSNARLVKGDCGSKLGVRRLVTNESYSKMVGAYIIINDKTMVVPTIEVAKTLVGKYVVKRSPMYCKTKGTDFCTTCLGDKLSASPTGLSLAISAYGSAILALFLAKMHGTALATSKMDIKTSLT